jgi:hypothetical protein
MEAVGYAVLLITVLAVAFFMLVAHAAREERQIATFRVSAAKGGWQERAKDNGPVPALRPSPDTLPVSVRHGPRLMIMMEKRVGGQQVWMTWHRWKVRIPSGGQGDMNWTRYLLSLGTGRYPDMTVARRKALGGLFRPIPGRGTGDPVFDRAFRVHPVRDADARRLLTDPLRQAMLAGALPPWRIRDSTLIITYPDIPAESTHGPRADAICMIANLVTARA